MKKHNEYSKQFVIRIFQKYGRILNRHQKLRILELGVLMLIGGFMEMLSVSLIIPFIEIVMDPYTMMNKDPARSLCSVLGIKSPGMFVAFLAICMAVLYLVKNLFLLFQMNVQNRFVFKNMLDTQSKLLRSYLDRPYEFFLSANTGEIMRIINEDTREVFLLMTTMLNMITELVVAVILIITIFVISPLVTLGMAVLLLLSVVIIQKVVRLTMRHAGEEYLHSLASMNQWLLQAMQGVKEVKVMKKEAFFHDEYIKSGKVFADTQRKRNVFGVLPRFLIEAVCMGSFFVMVAVMVGRGAALESIVPMLSAIAMAAIRLLPSANRISGALTNATYGEPMLDKTIENLSEIAGYDQDKRTETEPASAPVNADGSGSLAITNLSYRYPTGERDVLHEVNMQITRGQSVGIIGSSGAGKTTVADILLGLLQPQKGRVLYNGVDIREDLPGWLDKIGYIPQTINLLDGDFRDNVAFGVPVEERTESRIWDVLEEAQMAEYVRNLPEGLDTQLGERGIRLSGGQRQRIGIARALYQDPEILILDEATSALDNDTETSIMDAISHLHGRKTLLIIAHRLSTIEACDVVYRVENGKICLDQVVS